MMNESHSLLFRFIGTLLLGAFFCGVAMAMQESIDDVPLHPRRRRERQPDAQRHGQARKVDVDKGLRGQLGHVLAAGKVRPVPGQLVVAENHERDRSRPEGNLPDSVRYNAGWASLFDLCHELLCLGQFLVIVVIVVFLFVFTAGGWPFPLVGFPVVFLGRIKSAKMASLNRRRNLS